MVYSLLYIKQEVYRSSLHICHWVLIFWMVSVMFLKWLLIQKTQSGCFGFFCDGLIDNGCIDLFAFGGSGGF